MISNKYCLLILLIVLINSCSSEELIDEDRGYGLEYCHVSTDTLFIKRNCYWGDDVDLSISDLQIIVSSKYEVGSSNYYLEGDYDIEKQLANFIDPDGTKYNGFLPVPVKYTTEVCKSIRITLYDKDDTFIDDLTNRARFYYLYGPYAKEEDGGNLLIDSNKKLLGRIKHGTTIKEYLSYKPMLFGEAHFIFEGFAKDAFNNDTYVIVEIELENGKILKGIIGKSQMS